MINYLDPNFSNAPGRRKVSKAYKALTFVPSGHVDVSIITPFYNTEELFAETLMSVLAQSLRNWEWVIVDDGSTDAESVERLSRLTKDDVRIKVIRQENAGPASARNRAFENSHGRYICLLDSDDMIEPTYLEKCMWFLDSNPEFAFCNACSVVFGDKEFLWTQGFEQNKNVLRANSGPPISAIRREAFADVGGFDESIRFGHEDWDFWLAMAKAGHWGYTIREFLQWYRKRGNGRFEQIMRSGNVNEEFEKLMHRKYAGLEATFPVPQRRHPQPYESVQTSWDACNPLQPNPNGRRIMFILPWMVIGGADRVNLDLVEGLVLQGHDVTICATLPADHRWEYKFQELTPDVFVLPNILHPTDYPRFLAYLIDSRRIDTVVVTGSTIGYQLLPYLRAAAPKTAFVDLCHVEEPHWLNGGHPRFGVGYQDALDLNLVTTSHLQQWMTERGADPTRIRVMYAGVGPPRLNRSGENRQAVRARFAITDNLPVIIFAGRICEQKRPGLLAEVLRELRDAGLRFHALIIGDGELRPMFESLLDRYGLRSCVQMVGAQAHDQWLETLIGADIFLMPSQYEGISIALLEAMAAGVVPVVARVGGQEEIVGEKEGYLISLGEGELQEYVRILGKLFEDARDLASKSNACQALMVSKYSRKKTISDFEHFLSEAHQKINGRRCSFTLAMGRELASLALEYKRLGEAVDWLWNRQPEQQPQGANVEAMPTPEIAPLRRSSVISWRLFRPLSIVSRLSRGTGRGLQQAWPGIVNQLAIPAKRAYRALTQHVAKLPNGFDQDLYLKLNPDVAKSGVNPVAHYLRHGRHEGRVFSLLELDAGGDLKAERETILVVSHEASRTGAPVLALNLVQALVERYNVVVLLLAGGPLLDAFRLAGAVVTTAPNIRGNPELAHRIARQLCERFNFKFAVVNSVESRVVLPSLGNLFVPAITLIHEFASYTRPRDAFSDTLFWSGEVVFSANVTLENVRAEYPDLSGRPAHVLHQGRCLAPSGEFSDEGLQAEKVRIRSLIRPGGHSDNSVVVLGVGFVHLRKGVDLFIECAARVVHAPDGDRCRFVWIGKGYDPDKDVGYSVYIADQVRRAGLQEYMFFIDETAAIETAYEEADLFLLSSRLDPLPNVAIDALVKGVPVVCFDKTTGIAEFLTQSGLRNHCVANYLDSHDMAAKILALAGSRVLRAQVADRCREASIAYFDMKKYVARLDVLAQGACDRANQERADTQLILDSGLFERNLDCPTCWQGQSIEEGIRAYVRAWASGIGRRKPFPGFDPGVYLDRHGLTTNLADPFADYLRAGRPEGPWHK